MRHIEPSTDLSSLSTRLGEIERQLRTLGTAPRLSNTSIDVGSLTVTGGALVARDSAGRVLLHIGQGVSEDVPASADAVVVLCRPDGRQFFEHTGQRWVWSDEAGHTIFADDAAGQGLSRPLLPIPWHTPGAPSRSTTSAAPISLWSLTFARQHPQLMVQVMVVCPASTTGVVSLVDVAAGAVIASRDVDAGWSGPFNLSAPISGAHEEVVTIDLQAQRTSGAGAIAVEPLCAYGIGSDDAA